LLSTTGMCFFSLYKKGYLIVWKCVISVKSISYKRSNTNNYAYTGQDIQKFSYFWFDHASGLLTLT
jgi:hypothetical protein